jgi:hypothetical protein
MADVWVMSVHPDGPVMVSTGIGTSGLTSRPDCLTLQEIKTTNAKSIVAGIKSNVLNLSARVKAAVAVPAFGLAVAA